MAEINGTPGDEVLNGTSDDDTLNGLGGTNTLNGGLGNDTYIIGTFRTSFPGPAPEVDIINELPNQGIDTVRTAASFALTANLENLVLAASLGDILNIQFRESVGDFVKLERVASATNPLVGAWTLTNSTTLAVVTFNADGTFMMAEDGDPVANPSGHDGMERGTFTWNQETGAFTSNVITDTNGEWGLSHAGITGMHIEGDKLIVDEADGTIMLTRVASSTNAIVGSWNLADAAEDADHVAITFLANGTYMFAEQHAVQDAYGVDGMERGTYTWNATTGAFTTHTTVDTDLEWGFSDSPVQKATIETSFGTGNGLDNVITGNAFNNVLTGLAGNDTLDGKEGVNTLIGGLGDDTYIVGLGTDTIVELAGQGTDSVISSIGYTLGANLENLTLAGSQRDILHLTLTGGNLSTIDLARVADAANPLVGGWTMTQGPNKIAITFMADGTYMLAESGPPEDLGHAGMERGTYSWDPVNGQFTWTTDPDSDTNGTWGISDSTITSMQVDGNTLTVVDGGDTIVLTRAASATSPIVGSWQLADPGDDSMHVAVTFLANGTYLFAEEHAGAGDDAMEGGTYTWNATTGAFTTHPIDDTDPDLSFSVSHGKTATVTSAFGTGNALDNVLIGNALNNVLTGLAGNDTLDGREGINKLVGGLGNDTYIVRAVTDTVVEAAAQGTDTVMTSLNGYVLGANVENLQLAATVGDTLQVVDGGDTVNLERVANPANPLVGSWHIAGSEEVTVTFLANGTYLLAEDGEPEGSGQPGMERGTYTWDAETGAFTSHTITDTNGEWGLSHSNILSALIDSDTLTIDDNGNINVLSRVVDGTNPLVGGWHAIGSEEVLVTFLADGGYMLAEDGAPEGSGEPGMERGTFTWNPATHAFTSATITDTNGEWGLSNSSITSMSIAASTATGNTLNNTLTGNDYDNNLSGLAGDDVLIGNGGNDRLDGGAGNDRLVGGTGDDVMIGGLGNDTFVVDSDDDTVTELAGQGTDTVESFITYALAATLENLTLVGDAAVNGTGNALANVMIGNSAANNLDGGAGNDVITGGAGNDRLDGGIGADQLRGGLGDDTYVFGTGDVIVENLNEGTDTVESSLTFTLGLNFENLVLTGSAAINGTGNTLNNILTGNDANNILSGGAGNDTLFGGGGNDRLDGGVGADTMTGGDGDDVFVVDNAGDVVVEAEDGGTDTVQVTFGTSYSIASLVNIENVTLIGAVAMVTGNDGDNVLIGNAAVNTLIGGDGNDTLDGGAGADYLYGGLGDDTYVVDSLGDKVVEGSPQAPSIVIASTLSDGSPGLTATTATISGDGRYVVFESQSLDTGHDLARIHIFLKDLESGDLTRLDPRLNPDSISVGDSRNPLISADGSVVAFNSFDPTIINPPSFNGNAFVSHVGNPVVVDLISEKDGHRGNGPVSTDISADGKFVLFVTLSQEPDLTGLAGVGAMQSVVLADTTSGALRVVSYNGVAPAGGAASFQAKISADAGFVGFTSSTTNLVANDTNGTLDVFVRDLDLADDAVGAFTRVSTSSTGVQANGLSNMADISADGRYVLFNSSATNLVAGDTNAKADVFVKDRVTGETTRVSTSTAGVQANADVVGDSISADGRFVLFHSTATNLVVGDGNGVFGLDLFIKDRLTGQTTLITRNDDGVQIPQGSGLSLGELSDDGRYVVFGTEAQLTSDDQDFSMDIYRVTNPLFLEAGGGTDTVKAFITYTIAADIENLTLMGAAAINGTGNDGNNVITGNAAANILTGGLGNDTLDGGAGVDRLVGGLGDDTYVFGVGDVIVENVDQGTDLVLSAVTHVMALNVENLTLTGLAAINGTGNADANVITGNGANNILVGGAGNDTLIGAGGNDRLDGGLGDDVLQGGLGNDVYVVGTGNDTFTENLDEGTDTVESAANVTELADNIENITLVGTVATIANGNALNNTITGNAAANIFDAGEGNDTLIGLAGNDIMHGEAGDDTLDGGLGSDILDGGDGNDTFIFGIGDSIIDSDGNDTVKSALTFTLLGLDFIENLTLTGTAAINGTGNNGENVITGNAAANILSGGGGNDTLDGGAGNDTLDGGTGDDSMYGGAGNDTYIVDSSLDGAIELLAAAAGGIDLVKSSATFTLGLNVENLTLTGTGDIDGTGNELNNTITVLSGSGKNELRGLAGNDILSSGDGNDFLDGGTGIDSMTGGAGNDTYVVDNVADKVNETLAGAAGGLADLVQSSVTFTLGLNVENLELTGSANINGNGNALVNELNGNTGNNILLGFAGNDFLDGGAGNDTLDGGVGADTMVGGLGDDIFVLDNLGDTIVESDGLAGGVDTVKIGYANASATAITINLDNPTADMFTDIENVTITGTGLFNLTGNEADNILIGNALSNMIVGGSGNDTLDGGLGNDDMFGDDGDDFYFVNSLSDHVLEAENEGTDTVKTTVSWTLGANFENLTLLGTLAINGSGNDGDNVILGNVAANILTGGAGADTLKGDLGNDTLNGGFGADTLIGGLGNDSLTGGADADTFVFDKAASATNRDVITDFVHGVDHLQFDHFIFTGAGAAGALDAGKFHAGAGLVAANEADDRFVYNTTSGALYYDADGIGGTAAVQVATLNTTPTTHPIIDANDFFIT